MDRGSRRSRTELVAERRRRLLQTLVGTEVAALLDRQIRNRNPITCGVRGCRLCKGHKIDGLPHCRDVRRTLPDEPGARDRDEA